MLRKERRTLREGKSKWHVPLMPLTGGEPRLQKS